MAIEARVMVVAAILEDPTQARDLTITYPILLGLEYYSMKSHALARLWGALEARVYDPPPYAHIILYIE